MTVVSIEWALALALAAPHLLYGFIWFFPNVWQGRFGQQSVLVFDSVAWVLKGRKIESRPLVPLDVLSFTM